jgi:hypothetical protein
MCVLGWCHVRKEGPPMQSIEHATYPRAKRFMRIFLDV